jgi:hypothetical protein
MVSQFSPPSADRTATTSFFAKVVVVNAAVSWTYSSTALDRRYSVPSSATTRDRSCVPKVYFEEATVPDAGTWRISPEPRSPFATWR